MTAILLAVAAGLCWGIGEVCTKSVLHEGRVGPMTALAVRSTIALPLMWAVWAILMRSRAAELAGWLHAGPSTLAKLVLGSGLAAGAGGMICFYLALSRGDVSRIKPVAFVIAPATAVLLGWLVLGEPMSLRKAAALSMILAGLLLLTGS